jgi:AraC family transcriptional regulator of adaptative response / DNA-3-methyladenine glycosylase II
MASPVAGVAVWSSAVEQICGLSTRALDRARMSRDPRFDGKFFIAITSTRIYCRPICPSPHARRHHVRYFPTAAAATAAGFRPCLRCRPEAAPGTPAWLGTSAVVGRALRMIEDGFLDRCPVDALAARLGLGARHLQRLFVQHVGGPPASVAQTRRLHFAKRLLDETNLPITDIVFAAGFNSVRRFNSAFHQTFRRPPRDFRRIRHEHPGSHRDEIVLRLTYRPPYDWEQVREFLAVRSVPGIELLDGNAYMRTVATDSGVAVVRISPVKGEAALELRVTGATPSSLLQISSAARRVFDVAADPSMILAAFRDDPLLGPLVRKRPGLRIPGMWDPFECAVRAVIGQQISVLGARTLAARLVQSCGLSIRSSSGRLTHLFPTPTQLAAADLSGVGLTRARAAALGSLAKAAAEGALDWHAAPEHVRRSLTALPGIGDWTAEYVALRALGEPDAFPASDLVLRRMAADADCPPLSVRAMHQRAQAWRPWRGYAALHLWRAAADQAKTRGGL